MLSDTRVSIRLTPGCHATQHPGVRYAETRVSGMLRPGCQTSYTFMGKK